MREEQKVGRAIDIIMSGIIILFLVFAVILSKTFYLGSGIFVLMWLFAKTSQLELNYDQLNFNYRISPYQKEFTQLKGEDILSISIEELPKYRRPIFSISFKPGRQYILYGGSEMICIALKNKKLYLSTQRGEEWKKYLQPDD